MDFDIVTFFSDDIALNITMLNNVNFDYDDLDDCNPKIINHVRLMSWYNRYKYHKVCKIKDRQIVIPCSMASNKSVGLVHIKRQKKKQIHS